MELQGVDATEGSGFYTDMPVGIAEQPGEVLDVSNECSGLNVIHRLDGTSAQTGEQTERIVIIAAAGRGHHGLHQRLMNCYSLVEVALWHVMVGRDGDLPQAPPVKVAFL